MSELEREIHIDAPAERVYDVMMDPDTLAEWVSIHDAVEEAPQELHEGAELVQRVKVAGQRFKLRWKVEQAKRPERVVWQGRGPMGTKATATYEFSPNEGGCTFRYSNRYDLPGGPAGKLAGKAIVGVSGSEADRSLERLKKYIESTG